MPETKTRQNSSSQRRISGLTVTMLVTMLASAVVFSMFPELDLHVSGVFFEPGQGFVGERDAFVQSLYKGVPLMSRAIIIGLFIALFAYSIDRGQTGARRRIQVGFLIASLALGPGLLIDVVLKDNWGRARPAKIAEFGGTQTFTPALHRSDQCDNNCSFVSGHASAGFYLVSLGFLGNAVARRRWTLIGLSAGALFGFGRITQGGHFLSDIVFSFYATWFAAWLTWVIFRRLGWLPPDLAADPAGRPETA